MKPVSGSATPCSGQASKFSEKVVDCRLYNHLGNERLDIGYKNKNRINISPVVCSQSTAGSRINLVSIIFTSGIALYYNNRPALIGPKTGGR